MRETTPNSIIVYLQGRLEASFTHPLYLMSGSKPFRPNGCLCHKTCSLLGYSTKSQPNKSTCKPPEWTLKWTQTYVAVSYLLQHVFLPSGLSSYRLYNNPIMYQFHFLFIDIGLLHDLPGPSHMENRLWNDYILNVNENHLILLALNRSHGYPGTSKCSSVWSRLLVFHEVWAQMLCEK